MLGRTALAFIDALNRSDEPVNPRGSFKKEKYGETPEARAKRLALYKKNYAARKRRKAEQDAKDPEYF